MRLPFRHYHIIQILEGFDTQNLPLDYFLSNYFRANKAIGSKDRGFIAETVYDLIRWRGLIDFVCPKPATWHQKLELYLSPNWPQQKENHLLLPHIRLSFPKELYDKLVESHGENKATEICLASNSRAPTYVRVNSMKISRDDLLNRWKGVYDIEPCRHSPEGIVFNKRINFFELAEFKEGLFEVQDEGSQLVAQQVNALPGELVMDYCAGAGGKTLAFAPKMQNKGQIYLYDIRQSALQDSRKRLRRAGIQNAQIIFEGTEKLKRLKKKMDWVLVDAPCSGTGTLRRNPDMKWKFSEEMVKRLVSEQRVIFEKALSFVKQGGKIVYATCSILNDENQNQTDHFIKTYNLKLVGDPFISIPLQNEMDGFYCATFQKLI